MLALTFILTLTLTLNLTLTLTFTITLIFHSYLNPNSRIPATPPNPIIHA